MIMGSVELRDEYVIDSTELWIGHNWMSIWDEYDECKYNIIASLVLTFELP
jgi:hypothetical protein